ncbi:hypothetical protein AYI68_g5123 [Smittium mucronatum]|uniref:Uncharacterized protein n=1 Tax=Smittium mucronatum TaxID=133383 RepID=A0A1R0GV78_9FUNG|nr:hypothetical protein AYI68_g5123 [Smittium mucronatum]
MKFMTLNKISAASLLVSMFTVHGVPAGSGPFNQQVNGYNPPQTFQPSGSGNDIRGISSGGFRLSQADHNRYQNHGLEYFNGQKGSSQFSQNTNLALSWNHGRISQNQLSSNEHETFNYEIRRNECGFGFIRGLYGCNDYKQNRLGFYGRETKSRYQDYREFNFDINQNHFNPLYGINLLAPSPISQNDPNKNNLFNLFSHNQNRLHTESPQKPIHYVDQKLKYQNYNKYFSTWNQNNFGSGDQQHYSPWS